MQGTRELLLQQRRRSSGTSACPNTHPADVDSQEQWLAALIGDRYAYDARNADEHARVPG